MKLLQARVTNYESVEDSGWFDLGKVTCLVGKNESGKTAILEALRKLSPAPGETGDFDYLHDYPRRSYNDYKRVHKEKPATVVQVKAELTDAQIKQLEAEFGKGVLKSKQVTFTKDYANKRWWLFEQDDAAVVRHLLEQAKLPSAIQEKVETAANVQALIEALDSIDAKQRTPAVDEFSNDLKKRFKKTLAQQIIDGHLTPAFPAFVYFGDYSTMEGRISIPKLQERIKNNNISQADRTFISLLDFLGIKVDDLHNEEDFERLTAELEAAANSITAEVFRFWSQNKRLRVEFKMDTKTKTIVVRVWNDKHGVSVPFDKRSRGFVWFFSFLAYFSKFEKTHQKEVVLLLDEPGMSLHGKAQADFLRFIDERLAPKHDVIYTTHSPFMIQPGALDRVRTVEDTEEKGTIVSRDISSTDQDTVFPLQAALGYEIAQTLFVGPYNLLVEGPGDLLYLNMISLALNMQGKAALDPRWVIVPVGGADKVSTFVSLLGANKLEVVVLMDVSSKDRQRFDNLEKNALFKKGNLVHPGEITKTKNADIEDLFEPAFYIDVVNAAYGKDLPKPIKLDDLPEPGNTRIVKRLERYFADNNLCGGEFNHYRPAAFMLENQATWLKKLDKATLERFSDLMAKVNSLMPGNQRKTLAAA